MQLKKQNHNRWCVFQDLSSFCATQTSSRLPVFKRLLQRILSEFHSTAISVTAGRPRCQSEHGRRSSRLTRKQRKRQPRIPQVAANEGATGEKASGAGRLTSLNAQPTRSVLNGGDGERGSLCSPFSLGGGELGNDRQTDRQGGREGGRVLCT